MDNKKMQEAHDIFMKNEAWREYYETAPSENCKEYINNEFYFSKYDEFDERRDRELEDSFTIEDWKHLYKYAGNNPFRTKCRKKIEELS